MTLNDRHGHDAEAMALATLLRTGAEQAAAPDWEQTGLERLKRSASIVHQTAAHKRHRWVTASFAAAACVLVIAGAWFGVQGRVNKFTFEVQGADLSNPHYVVAPAESDAHMKFSDGSTVDLVKNTRMRVQQVTAQGASLVLERGSAVTHVVHHADSNWKVFAGPFEISVIGTRFKADWDPQTETLQVDLYEGTIQIGGERAGEMAVLKNGQRFHAVGHKANWSISPIGGGAREAAADAMPQASVLASPSALTPEQLTPVEASSVAPPVPARTQRDWAGALAKGEFSRIVSDAESRGIASCLDQCSVADVRYLADAARYTRRFDLAEQAFLALRRRSASEAPTAAYLLGVINESQGRNASALRWYEQCASEAPRGRFVSDAQAGRLRMLMATHQHAEAQVAAKRYLRDYPRGVGEATAKKILDSLGQD
jgi:hypothetical protein